jgi:hypothetical protein
MMEVTREEAERFVEVLSGTAALLCGRHPEERGIDYLRAVVRALDGEHVCRPSAEFVEAVEWLYSKAVITHRNIHTVAEMEHCGNLCNAWVRVRAAAAKDGIEL